MSELLPGTAEFIGWLEKTYGTVMTPIFEDGKRKDNWYTLSATDQGHLAQMCSWFLTVDFERFCKDGVLQIGPTTITSGEMKSAIDLAKTRHMIDF